MNARSNGDPQVYEAGGKWAEAVPAGYWIDLTDMAGRYGWNREAALVNWRTFYQGTRFNELVMTGGLDWKSAMLQIYPPEILSTPTQPAPVSKTPTPYPAWYKTRVPTQTSSPTITPSLRPTWTPAAPSP
jgi:hypothetical protein